MPYNPQIQWMLLAETIHALVTNVSSKAMKGKSYVDCRSPQNAYLFLRGWILCAVKCCITLNTSCFYGGYYFCSGEMTKCIT